MHTSDSTVAYDQFVVDGGDKVYMVELTRLKVSKAPRVSLVRPLTFAVDKDKLWIRDEDRAEYETKILKQVDKAGLGIASAAQPAPPAAQPEKVAQVKAEQTKVEKPKPQSTKPDNVFATAALSKDDGNAPKPEPAPEQVKPAPEQVKVVAPPPAQVASAPPAAPAANTRQDSPAQTVAAVVPPKQNQLAPTVVPKSDVKPAAAPAIPESKPQPKSEATLEASLTNPSQLTKRPQKTDPNPEKQKPANSRSLRRPRDPRPRLRAPPRKTGHGRAASSSAPSPTNTS